MDWSALTLHLLHPRAVGIPCPSSGSSWTICGFTAPKEQLLHTTINRWLLNTPQCLNPLKKQHQHSIGEVCPADLHNFTNPQGRGAIRQMSWRGLQESRRCGQSKHFLRAAGKFLPSSPVLTPQQLDNVWCSMGKEPQKCKYKSPVGCEIKQWLNPLFLWYYRSFAEPQPGGKSTAQPLTREGCTRGQSSLVGIYWDRKVLPLSDTQRMPPFESCNKSKYSQHLWAASMHSSSEVNSPLE